MWHCRLLPGVLRAWRTVWALEGRSADDAVAAGDDALATSFDGCGVWRNPLRPEHGPRVRTDGNWFHLDQVPW
jgi:hypothetical protein